MSQRYVILNSKSSPEVVHPVNKLVQRGCPAYCLNLRARDTFVCLFRNGQYNILDLNALLKFRLSYGVCVEGQENGKKQRFISHERPPRVSGLTD